MTMDATSSLLGSTKKKPCCQTLWKKQPWEMGTLSTEYQKEFYEKGADHGGPPPRAHAMQPALKAGGEFYGGTTYHNTYKTWEASYAGPVRPKHAFTGSAEPMDPWTTYKMDYPAKAVPYQRARRQADLPQPTGAFEDGTTHRNDFQDPGPSRPVAAATSGRAVSVPRGAGPFEGASLYKADYRRHPLTCSMPAVPTSRGQGAGAALGTGAFDDATMYKTAYTLKEGMPASRVKPQDNNATGLPGGWYEGVVPSTEYNDTYFGKAGRPASRAGPTTGPSSGMPVGDGRFHGDTTYGHTFRPTTAPSPPLRARPVHGDSVPMGDGSGFEGRSMYAGEFTPKMVAYSRVKPSSSFQPSKDKLDDDTTHRTAFKDFGTVPTARAVGRNGTSSKGMGNPGPFEGMSTYKQDFIKQHGGSTIAPGRPVSGTHGLVGSGPFDDSTTYKRDFLPKALLPHEMPRPTTAYCESCDDDPHCVDC